MKNKFNWLTSKEWLPFQKSWFRFESDEKMYTQIIRFFTKADEVDGCVLYSGQQTELMEQICKAHKLDVKPVSQPGDSNVQFALFDLREQITPATTLEQYEQVKHETINAIKAIYNKLVHRRFVSIMLPNVQHNGEYYPYAWDLAKHVATILSIKDEKIACIANERESAPQPYFKPAAATFYTLYFRKDEHSEGTYKDPSLNFFRNNKQKIPEGKFAQTLPAWFILKPKSRKKKEILHPAKYPEELVEMFVKEFTGENANVFDPMSGTGSTQIGAMRQQRNGYGTELSEFFAGIAQSRCRELVTPEQSRLFEEKNEQVYKILNKDARQIDPADFPAIDYVFTSPPYWDMLNMKGAENQAKRKGKGLKTNYSDDVEDLGNISDYDQFINELLDVYFKLYKLMKPGAYMTIVVKNIKKKGRNYPFAWDLSHALQQKFILMPEVFWLQDDISIAPYGYGNTWVSNTFHQYCLNFQKPPETS